MRNTYRVASFAVVSAIGLVGGLYAGDQFGRVKALSVVTGSLIHESALQAVVLSGGKQDRTEGAIDSQAVGLLLIHGALRRRAQSPGSGKPTAEANVDRSGE